MSQSSIFQIWHADPEAPMIPQQSLSLGTSGEDVETCVRRAAELAANLDADANLYAWPTTYCVLDRDGRLWRVLVDRVTRPTYGAVDLEEAPPMPPAVHVLWQGSVACQDVRLAGVPANWPEGQRWMSLTEFAAGNEPAGPYCALCWKRAPSLIPVVGAWTPCPACQIDPDPRGYSACHACRKINRW